MKGFSNEAFSLKEKGFKTLKQLNINWRKKQFPEELLVGGIDTSNGVFYPPETLNLLKEFKSLSKGEKIKKTNLKKYNVENVSQIQEIKELKIAKNKKRNEQNSFENKKQFIEKANKIHNNFYNYSLVNYYNSRTKVKIICPIHGIFEQIPKAHLCLHEGCPKCKNSKGEIAIRKFLTENNILFEEQKTFDSLKDTKQLSYDFYIPEKNLLIEYNGIQHYEIVEHFGGRKRFLLQKHHDWLKRKFAKDNNFNLLTISYKEKAEDKLKLII